MRLPKTEERKKKVNETVTKGWWQSGWVVMAAEEIEEAWGGASVYQFSLTWKSGGKKLFLKMNETFFFLPHDETILFCLHCFFQVERQRCVFGFVGRGGGG